MKIVRKIIERGAKMKGYLPYLLSLVLARILSSKTLVTIAIIKTAMLVAVISANCYYTNSISKIVDYSPVFASENQRTSTDKVVIHHTAVDSDTIRLLDVYEKHKFENKWQSGFAYHYFIMNGATYKIHRDNDATGHAYHVNETAIALCMQADWSVQTPSHSDYLRCAIMAHYLMRKYSLKVDDVIGHREIGGMNKTECPGINFSMEKLRMYVRFIDLIVID